MPATHTSAPQKSSVPEASKPKSTPNNALGQVCAAIPWATIVQDATPYVKKYTVELLKLAGTGIKKLVASSKCTGSCSSGFPVCCSGPINGGGPSFAPAPGRSKIAHPGRGDDETSLIEYPRPFQDKQSSTAAAKRLSKTSWKRRSFSTAPNRASVIAAPVPFS